MSMSMRERFVEWGGCSNDVTNYGVVQPADVFVMETSHIINQFKVGLLRIVLSARSAVTCYGHAS